MDLYTQIYGKSKEYFESKNCTFTSYEIAHQPLMWRALATYLKEVAPKITAFMNSIPDLKNIRVILTGAGSSGYIGRAIAGFVAKATGIRCEGIHTTDIVSAPETYLYADVPTLLVSFARSGNSPESVGTVEYARKIVKNLYELDIVCDGTSRLATATRNAKNGLLLVMPEGTNDNGFAMTSSVSTMILAGVATFMHSEIPKIADEIVQLANHVEKNGLKMAKAAEECATWGYERAWYLANGALTAIAFEGSLKMMELTNGAVVSGHSNAPEFRHGPKTVINPKTVTVHFVSNDEFTAKYDMDLVNEMYSQRDGNKMIVLHDETKQVQGDMAVPYKSFGYEVAVGIQGLLFMQLLSMYTSLQMGLPTDNPSPSGLVNRVVQGVTVYPY